LYFKHNYVIICHMTPPKVPEGRPYTPEELLHTLYADAFTATEDLFRVLRESRIGNQEISVFSFEDNLSHIQVPAAISNAMPNPPSRLSVSYMEENGKRPDLRLTIDYGDNQIHLGRAGDSGPNQPFGLVLQQGRERNSNYAPIAATEVNQLLTSLALKEDFVATFGTARLRALDVQDPKIAELLKAGLLDGATKTEHVSDYEIDLQDKDNYWLRARQNTITSPTSYTLTVGRSEEQIDHMQSKVTTMEVTLVDTLPDAKMTLQYEHKVEIHSPFSSTNPEYSLTEQKDLDSTLLSFLVAACNNGKKTLRSSMTEIVAYEHYAEQQLDKDDQE
jgi:hypothetical protein